MIREVELEWSLYVTNFSETLEIIHFNFHNAGVQKNLVGNYNIKSYVYDHLCKLYFQY